ncbi:MAG: YfcE family phosphodiesterase, partial [Acidilobaceae archaeon]
NQANVVRAARLFKSHGVSLVVHLGDIVSPFTLRRLVAELGGARVEAVFGNNDGEKSLLHRVAGELGVGLGEPPRSIVVDGRRLLLLHGLGGYGETLELVVALAESKRWDAVLYGHTHVAHLDYVRRVLVLNPGDASGYLGKPSVALLDTKSMKARLVPLEG